ncbi:MAG: ABC transporter permease, partial [Clostridia bacterium]|nr:ABC transporter permease [Clostridia bacterium]
GFTAIIVAWLSKFNTFVMVGVSILIVALENGSMLMANTYGDLGFSPASAKIIVGVMLLLIIGCEFFINYKLAFRSRAAKKEEVTE